MATTMKDPPPSAMERKRKGRGGGIFKVAVAAIACMVIHGNCKFATPFGLRLMYSSIRK